MVVPIEEHLEAQENYVRIMEEKFMADRRRQRLEALAEFASDPTCYGQVETMSDEAFALLVKSAREAHAEKMEAERKAREESERKAAEEAEEKRKLAEENRQMRERLEAERTIRESAEKELREKREQEEAARKLAHKKAEQEAKAARNAVFHEHISALGITPEAVSSGKVKIVQNGNKVSVYKLIDEFEL